MKEQKVYSYIRFSRPEQALGDSERRQTENAAAYAKRIGLPLDDSLKMADRGLSGFKGDNVTKGALSVFLEKVNSGQVTRGSVLVVENVDRISRLDFFEAFEIVSSIIRQGVTIHTLSPEGTYDQKSASNGSIHALVGQIQLAHDESKKKSERLKEAWKSKREKGEFMTKRMPDWLEKRGDEIAIKEGAAETITQIFEMYYSGLSAPVIARQLNESAPWSRGRYRKNQKSRGWRESYIKKILKFESVIGRFQPHKMVDEKRKPEGEPIEGYFPPVVDRDLFFAVQQKLDERASQSGQCGGRTGKVLNLFTHIVKCPYCGGSMAFVNKGNTKGHGKYLVCDNTRRGVKNDQGEKKCHASYAQYDELEELVLTKLLTIRPEEVLPSENDAEQVRKSLRTRCASIEDQIGRNEAEQDNLRTRIRKTSNQEIADDYEKDLLGLKEAKKSLDVDLAETQKKLREAEKDAESFNEWQTSLSALLEKINGGDILSRSILKDHLRTLIERIDVFSEGSMDSVDSLLDEIEETHREMIDQDCWTDFSKYVRHRLMSKGGRFYRIHLKGQNAVSFLQLAPKDSLVPRREQERRSNKKVVTVRGESCVESLIDEFQDKRIPGFQPKPLIRERLNCI